MVSNWSKTADFEAGINDLYYVGFQMRQDPNNSNTYVVATSEGVFRTTNGGGVPGPNPFSSISMVSLFLMPLKIFVPLISNTSPEVQRPYIPVAE
jgi:hypothetical protein